MPLTSLTLSAQLAWAMDVANDAPFADTTQGQDSQSFTLDGISLTSFPYLYAKTWKVSPSLSAPAGPAAVAAAGGTLAPATYYYKITATGGAGVQGETTGSGEVNATAAAGNLKINLTWTASANASGYNVYRGTSAGTENLLIASPATNSYSDTGAAAGTAASVPGSNTSGYYEFSLLAWASLIQETLSLGHALSMLVIVGSGGQGKLGPGQTNGLIWFVADVSDLIPLPISGVLLYSLPAGATGKVVDASHNTLRITNTGTTNHTSTVLIAGGA